MRLAVVGSGISGLVCAYLLRQAHDVTLFEANDYPGGHTHTVTVAEAGRTLAIDTGFIVCNDRTYPRFLGLLEELGVAWRPTEMGFSVSCARCGLEYSGGSLATLFAQKRNLLRPSFLRMLRDILRFNRLGTDRGDEIDEEVTLGEFLRRKGYSSAFAEHYLLPMGAAIWSCPMETFADFPVRFVVDFYRHHGLLQLRNRPTWFVIPGGSRTYVDRMVRPLGSALRLRTPVLRVERGADCVRVVSRDGTEEFDEVIFACHSDQALRLVGDASAVERRLLGAFPYGRNSAVLHTDVTLLPRLRRTWSSWNYRVPVGSETRPCVTYNMNILQHLESAETYCVTLNADEAIAPERALGRFEYEHPIFSVGRAAAQARHGEVIRQNRTSFCGAYWGNGFHEDGVVSALAVCAAYGVTPRWGRQSTAINGSDVSGDVAEEFAHAH
jgi:predicted NAD/FAD-binding protein